MNIINLVIVSVFKFYRKTSYDASGGVFKVAILILLILMILLADIVFSLHLAGFKIELMGVKPNKLVLAVIIIPTLYLFLKLLPSGEELEKAIITDNERKKGVFIAFGLLFFLLSIFFLIIVVHNRRLEGLSVQ